MNNKEDWQANNDRYLMAAMAWLGLLLEFKAQGEGISASDVAAAERAMAAAEMVSPVPALTRLRQQLELSQFETNILLLCLAMEWDKNIPNLYGIIQGREQYYPTFYLGFVVFEDPSWDVVSPERPLRKWRLIEIMQSGVEPTITCPLRADESIVNYIKGLQYLDDRLGKLVFPWQGTAKGFSREEIMLPPSQENVVREIMDQFQEPAADGRGMAVELLGPDTASKELVAWQVCRGLQLELYRLPIALLPTESEVLEALARLWARESLLSRVALYIDLQSGEDYITPGQRAGFFRFLARGNGCFFIDCYDRTVALEGDPLCYDIAKPTSAEQVQAWERALGPGNRELVMGLVGQFNLNIAQIEKAVGNLSFPPDRDPVDCMEQVPLESEDVVPTIVNYNMINFNIIELTSADLRGDRFEIVGMANRRRPTGTEFWDVDRVTRSLQEEEQSKMYQQLWDSCLEIARPKLDNLAQRIDVKAGWNDIVLPEEEMALLHQIAQQVRQRGKVYEEWGFHRRMNRGQGISALFAGESGTGKTMAAEVIAKDLGLHLYRIDLATVVSKYIGETEKNLRRLFDAAEDGGAILFFDEADALFGKRSEVKDAHDRYANIEINYLLQRLEAYRGLAILATNNKNAIDRAFLRRLRFVVNFPVPGVAERTEIWQKVFPKKTPIEGVDWNRLSQFNLTGGNIHSIALNAAFLAASGRTAVTMKLLLAAARMEFKKLDKLINEADFGY